MSCLITTLRTGKLEGRCSITTLRTGKLEACQRVAPDWSSSGALPSCAKARARCPRREDVLAGLYPPASGPQHPVSNSLLPNWKSPRCFSLLHLSAPR